MGKIVVGRHREKAIFDKMLNRQEASFVAVYGRRRVGKTYLIRQYLLEHTAFDFTGQQDTAYEPQLENFFDEYLKRTKAQKETKAPQTWNEAFRYLSNYLLSLKGKEKLVVFLDEIPWIDSAKSGFLSALEFFWNQNGIKMDRLILVVCGSSSSWIIKNLLHARGGLHNRLTQSIHLKPFDLKEVKDYLSVNKINWPPNLIIDLYMITGGIPHYLKEIQKDLSLAQNIDQLCFQTNGILRSEYDHLFQSLFRDADNHIKVIETLASTHYGITQSEIIEKSNLPQSSISKILKELIECDFIIETKPFGRKKKESQFRIIDPYTIFYLKFIKPNLAIQSSNWMSLQNTRSYESWCGYAFENICFSHIHLIKQALGISGINSEISSWTYQGDDTTARTQIDLIIDRSDKCINLCKIKYASDSFTLTNEESTKIKKRKSTFQSITQTKKQNIVTLITNNDVIKNGNYLEVIEKCVKMGDLI